MWLGLVCLFVSRKCPLSLSVQHVVSTSQDTWKGEKNTATCLASCFLCLHRGVMLTATTLLQNLRRYAPFDNSVNKDKQAPPSSSWHPRERKWPFLIGKPLAFHWRLLILTALVHLFSVSLDFKGTAASGLGKGRAEGKKVFQSRCASPSVHGSELELERSKKHLAFNVARAIL